MVFKYYGFVTTIKEGHLTGEELKAFKGRVVPDVDDLYCGSRAWRELCCEAAC